MDCVGGGGDGRGVEEQGMGRDGQIAAHASDWLKPRLPRVT